ncbi:hypothetical protein Tco_1204208 [Tanacetum coccineum]
MAITTTSFQLSPREWPSYEHLMQALRKVQRESRVFQITAEGRAYCLKIATNYLNSSIGILEKGSATHGEASAIEAAGLLNKLILRL